MIKKDYNKTKKKTLFQSNKKIQRVKSGDESLSAIGKDNQLSKPSNQETEYHTNTTEIKHSLLEIFNRSDAKAALMCMLNGRIPPQFRPKGVLQGGAEKITPTEHRAMVAQIRGDFKWAVEQMVKMFPKELGVFGSLQMNHTLAGMVRRASTDNKSNKVIDMVKKRREEEVTEYEEAENG